VLAHEEATTLLPSHVAVLWLGWRVPLTLHPLLVYRERGATVDVLLLNPDRSGRYVEYLSYTQGEPEKDPAMVPALAALLNTVAGQTITSERLEALGEQSMAALKLNEQAKPFTFPGVDGKMHALSDYQDKEAVAVIFSCNHYPYVKAWEDRMVQIQGDYSPKGVHGGIGVQDSEAL
jgi:hypothetical protein